MEVEEDGRERIAGQCRKSTVRPRPTCNSLAPPLALPDDRIAHAAHRLPALPHHQPGALAGIGCHSMALLVNPQQTTTWSHM
ncbi:hypothetical protein ACEN8K_39325, partial [Variovorax sp. CT11-76]